MGFLSRFFPRQQAAAQGPPLPIGYTTFTEYAPSFATWDGTLYEQLLTRTAVERFAVACSSLKPEVVGNPKTKPKVRALFESTPNEYSTWPQFVRRVATLYETDTTAYILPELDQNLDVVSLHAVKPDYVEVCEYMGQPWGRFYLPNGQMMVIEWRYVCILAKFQYLSDYFGGGNEPLDPTLALTDAQRQAEELAVKNGARIRFIGQVTSMTHEDDLRKKRDRFAADNLGPGNTSGLMVYDSTFNKIEQVKEDRFTLDPDEMSRIENNVFDYFGTNRAILQNSFTEDQWNAYYEGKVEPFAVALSEGLSNVLFTRTERKHGNRCMFSSNRLQYASNSTKRAMVSDMIDRGILSINQALEILQLPPIPGGDVRLVRGEFYQVDEMGNVVVTSGGDPNASKDEPREESKDDKDDPEDDDKTEEADDAV